jgi:hypothetical protein
MNYQQHNNFNLTDFLSKKERAEQLITTQKILAKTTNSLLDNLTEECKALDFMIEVVVEFQQLVRRSFQNLKQNPVAEKMLQDLSKQKYETCEELKAAIASILMRLLFSQGKLRLFSKHSPRFFNKRKYKALAQEGYYIPEEWVEQLMTCLSEKKAGEDMILHQLTPEWMWVKIGPLLLNLYSRTEEAIQNENKQHGKTTHT